MFACYCRYMCANLSLISNIDTCIDFPLINTALNIETWKLINIRLHKECQ